MLNDANKMHVSEKCETIHTRREAEFLFNLLSAL